MNDLRTAAQQALWALQYHVEMTWPIDRTSEAIFNLRAALAQQQAGSKGGGRLPPPLQAEPDLSRCPQCNGPADNGHDRSIPPNPYLCTRCMAEPVHKCPNCASLEAQNTELDRKLAEMEQAEPVQEPVAWRHKGAGHFTVNSLVSKFSEWEPLYTAPPQRKPLSLTDLQEALVLTNLIDRDAIEDPKEYDEGSTMAQIDELHRIIKE